MKPKFAFTFLLLSLAFVASAQSSKPDGDTYYKVCGSFSEFKNLVEKLVTEKAELDSAIQRILASDKEKVISEDHLRQFIKQDGLLMCAAFAESALEEGALIDRVCSVYTNGALSWGGKRAFDDNKDIKDPVERNAAIERGVRVSLDKCRTYIRKNPDKL